MMHFLRRRKIKAGDGKYDFRIVPAPTAGAAEESVFLQEFPNPLYPLAAGAGVVTGLGLRQGTQFFATQPPQVFAQLAGPYHGPGGIPSPDQSFVLQGLEDDNQ